MKKCGALIRQLSKRIDKIIITASYCILFLFLLTLAPSILYQERLVREGVWQEYREIKNDKFNVMYALNTGDNKPLIRIAAGDELLAVDGFKSTINVNGIENQSFWNHTFRNVVEESSVVRHNMICENYQLMQTTTLQEEVVVIEYRVKSTGGEDNFDLTLNLWHEYQEFSLLKIDNTYVNDNYWEENQWENQPELKYVVWMQTDPQPDHMENSPYWVELEYHLDNLAVGEAWGNPIVTITVSYFLWEPENQYIGSRRRLG